MSEFEDKLGSILSNQEAMSQIMALAQSLGGGAKQEGDPPPPDAARTEPAPLPPPAPAAGPSSPSAGSGDILSALGNLDPRLISMAMRLASEYNSNSDDRAALLNALRPFVRPERYAKLDKAIQISKLTRLIRVALDSFKHRGEDDV